MKTIKVSEKVKERLDKIKEENGHTSYDSALRSLLAGPCKGEKCVWYWNCEKYGCPGFKEKEEGDEIE